MKEAAEHERELEALRERLTRLSQASLRVNESLDPDTVLQEVMDGARSLTGARFGAIMTFDGSGQLVEFITSGLPPEEQQQMLDLREGPALFEYFLARADVAGRDRHRRCRRLHAAEAHLLRPETAHGDCPVPVLAGLLSSSRRLPRGAADVTTLCVRLVDPDRKRRYAPSGSAAWRVGACE